jgi:hypothetical protein
MAVAALALFGCNQALENPAANAPDHANIGVSTAGNTSVTITFSIVGVDDTYRSNNSVGNNNQGTCTTGPDNNGTGYWTTAGKDGKLKYVGPDHQQCSNHDGSDDEDVTINAIANWVVAPSGNKNLNFSNCGYNEVWVDDPNSEDPEIGEYQWLPNVCNAPTFIHSTAKGVTTGGGVVGGTSTLGNAWTINLAQVNALDQAITLAALGAPPLSSSITPLTACKVGGGCLTTTTMSW